ncbi:MAG TPA: flagellar hook-associated protein FlgK, partial [Stellaceae bacterium]|nr:flagellar hook-associated protein FlgK [Stellaceae bacterium]
MSLGVALANAVSGLTAAQANLTLISGNIANAQTPGYSRETLPQTSQVLDGNGSGVDTGVARRVSDQVLTASVRSQTSVTAAANTLNTYFQQIQNLFGQVGDANSLPDTLNQFSSALQTLATTPEDTVAQSNAVDAGQALASQLNGMSSAVQTLRSNADAEIGTSVTDANQLLTNIAGYNGAIARAQTTGQSTATIADQLDQALAQLAQQMNITSFSRPDGSVVVMTGGGKTLVDGVTAQQLSFTPSSSVAAGSVVSGITVNGIAVTGDITSGNIAGLLQMRDTQLPALTAELNQFTNQLFNTTKVTQSTQLVTVGGGAPNAGDTFQVTIDGQVFNTAGIAGNTVAGIVNAINTQLGATTFSASVSNGGILITDSAGNPLTATIVQTGGTGTATFTPQSPANALPTTNSGTSGAAPGDANAFFAGVNTATGLDNAGTIAVNPSLAANPALLDGVANVPSPTIAAALADALSLNTPTFAAAGNIPAAQ